RDRRGLHPLPTRRSSDLAGLGLAAVRDMASAMKYQPDIVAPGKLAYMYGSSQTGRTLRLLIHAGFTIDEQERKVFDAAFVKTGGDRKSTRLNSSHVKISY